MALDKSKKGGDGAQTQSGQNLPGGSGQTPTTVGLTSIDVGKQYGGADVRKLIEDALSADGRAQKDRADRAETELIRLTEAHTGLSNQFQTVSQQVSDLLKLQDEREVDSVKDDPVAVGSLRARQANRAESLRLQSLENQIRAREVKAAERETEAGKKLTSVSIKLAAVEAGVDEAQLADLVPDGNPERLKKMANILKASGVTTQQPGDKTKPAGLTQRPASAVSVGGETKGAAESLLAKAKAK